LLEGATFSGGTVITPQNMHRVGTPVASALTVKKDITGITGGVDLFGGPLYLGVAGAANRSSIGGNTGESSERVLRPETTYIIKITSIEPTNAINMTIVPFWYEESSY